MKIESDRFIKLEGAHNIRDLGGYPTELGVTRRGVFFRGDSTADLTRQDVATLRGLGVTAVIDLRSTMETIHAPSRLVGDEFHYVNIPMLDHVNSGPQGGHFPESMGEVYAQLLKTCRDDYRAIFTQLAEAQGACLFHCTAGKDRTGVVAMLLLKLAEAPEKTVIMDYVATDAFLRGTWDARTAQFTRKGLRIPTHALRADRANMVYALSQLSEYFGGARQYLLDCGIEQAQLNRLLAKFIVRQE